MAQEKERLSKLRDDFLKLQKYFEEGKLSYTALDKENATSIKLGWGEKCPENAYVAGVSMSAIKSFSSLFYYPVTVKDENDEEKTTVATEAISMTVFRNSAKEAYDLCYETVSFLDFVAEKYA